MTDDSTSDLLESPPDTSSSGETPQQAGTTPPDLGPLMPLIGAGNEAAFETFYRATLTRAHALVRRIVRDSHAVDDVLEEAYWQVWRDAPRYVPERGAVLAWFMTICRSRALDYLRKQGPAHSHPDPTELQSEEAAMEAAFAAPPDLMAALQTNSQLHEALALLPTRDRQIIALAFFRDASYPEIAAAYDMPLSSVKTVIRRAFVKLKAAMQQHDIKPTLQ